MEKLLIILAIVLLPVSVFAQTGEIVEHNGQEGYWFPKETGDKILEDLIKYKKLQELNYQLELKIDRQQSKIVKLEYMIEIGKMIELEHKGIIDLKNDQIKLLTKENDKLRAESNKWYNSKVLWFSAGFLISSVLCVGSVYSIGSIIN